MDAEIDRYISCSCGSTEHTLRYTYDKAEDELYTSVYIGGWYPGFFGRTWLAIKYVFGYKCKYGHFDCFIAEGKKIDEFKTLISEIDAIRNPS